MAVIPPSTAVRCSSGYLGWASEFQGTQLSPYRCTGGPKRRPFALIEGQLDDPLHPAPPQDNRDTDADVALSVFPLQVDAAGNQALLVADDGLHHLGNRRPRREEGAAAHQLRDLRAAAACASDDALDALGRK